VLFPPFFYAARFFPDPQRVHPHPRFLSLPTHPPPFLFFSGFDLAFPPYFFCNFYRKLLTIFSFSLTHKEHCALLFPFPGPFFFEVRSPLHPQVFRTGVVFPPFFRFAGSLRIRLIFFPNLFPPFPAVANFWFLFSVSRSFPRQRNPVPFPPPISFSPPPSPCAPPPRLFALT